LRFPIQWKAAEQGKDEYPMYDIRSNSENKTPKKFKKIGVAELITISTYFLRLQS